MEPCSGTLEEKDLRPGEFVQLEKVCRIGEALQSIKYLLRAPKFINSSQVPIVVFLHGSSARGNDLDKVRRFGLPRVLAIDSKISDICMYTVAPLCPTKVEWKDPAMCSLVICLLDYICCSLNTVDKSRVYCTGISMGGLGTWMLAARNPRWFAALAPICGGGSPVYARLLTQVPFYFFHSEDDNVVGVEETDRLVAALLAEDAVDVKYTRYTHSPDPSAHSWMVGHNCWDKAYSDLDFWEWLFSKRL